MGPEIQQQDQVFDFEQILPYAIQNFIPAGLTGLLIAGLLAAFMSTFAATVNAAPAYFVSDIYRRYINPNADKRTYIRMSYLVSALLVAIGIGFGLLMSSINEIMQWLFGALFGGYAAANLLKWHWWRFNGYGYFWGMIAGLLGSLILPLLWPEIQPLYAFPYLLLLGLLGSIFGSLLTAADDEQVLCEFVRTVRPWGWWQPVYHKLQQQQPGFKQNKDLPRDMLNIMVGMIWQISLVVLPIYLVIKEFDAMVVALMVMLACCMVLKKNWYDKLED